MQECKIIYRPKSKTSIPVTKDKKGQVLRCSCGRPRMKGTQLCERCRKALLGG